MIYLRKLSSLQERASTQVAINLCQDNGFKEVALCLEKPTYGAFLFGLSSSFVTDPKKLSAWANKTEDGVNEHHLSFNEFIYVCGMNVKDMKMQWDAAIEEQCQRLTEGLPRFLKHGVHASINRIALEYLSYSRRQEALFEVSRYFLMDVLTTGDWTEVGRLDEKKLAKRLVRDKRLTVLQRYRIACVYCLHINISELWKTLTQKEKQISKNTYFPQESYNLVLLWSQQMDSHQEEKVTRQKSYQWTSAAQQAMRYGNRAALMSCWKRLEKDIRQRMVIDMALEAVKIWQSMLYKHGSYMHNRKKLFKTSWPSTELHELVKHFNLPSYYTELMCFFLSEMAEEQQLTFFKKAFQSKYCDSVLESFLDWPHQDDFLPTINRVWGIVPMDKYRKCLLTLASKCSGEDENENRYYDYRNLLWMLWEKTPEEYKKYVFRNKNLHSTEVFHVTVVNEGKVFLPLLLERTPFEEKDETLFKRVFFDQPQEERKAMMCSKVGENICSILTQKEKWSFSNWLLEGCLPKEEIPSYKKQFIQSYCGQNLCISKLEEDREKFVEDLIDWSFALVTERTQYKYELINGSICLQACKTFLIEEKFTEVERLINFCLSSDEMKEQFKVHLARYTCSSMLKTCYFLWEQMDKILVWSVGAEEKVRDFKKELFIDIGVYSHYESVFICRMGEDVHALYKWFGLSSEEIKELKKDTMFYETVIDDIADNLLKCLNSYIEPLLYCVTDRKMIIDFKKEVTERCFGRVIHKSDKEAKIRFDSIIDELLYFFEKKEAQVKTSRESVFMNDKGEKRSTATEDKSPRKRLK